MEMGCQASTKCGIYFKMKMFISQCNKESQCVERYF